MRSTHTYAVLDVAATTFADVCMRLKEVGVLGEYLMKGEEGAGDLVVFGTTALRALPQMKMELGIEELPPVELVDVPHFEHEGFCPHVKALMHGPPWKRVAGAKAPTIDNELGGILVGFSVILKTRECAVDDLMLRQAMAEIKNVILLCGGKLPKPIEPADELPAPSL